MYKVTEAAFWAAIGPRDVHPTPGPERSVWKDQRTGAIVGYTYPGWLCRNVLGEYQAQTEFFLQEAEDA